MLCAHDDGTSSRRTHCKKSAKQLPLLETYDACKSLHMLTMLSMHPSPTSASLLADAPSPRGSDATLASGVHCPRVPEQFVTSPLCLPSSRTPLLGPSPLRTVLKTFAIYGSSPSNALLGRTRLRDGKMEAMNLVAALWVKKNAVRSAFRATHHQGKAVVKPPSGEAGDSLVAYGAASVLLTPEKAKSGRTPK